MISTELRIGNVIDGDAKGMRVVAILNDYIIAVTPQGNEITQRMELIKPTELTDEWKERLGFKGTDTRKGFYHLQVNKSILLLVDKGKWELMTRINKIPTAFPCPQLKYVHSLQNLIFALTGSEIEIKQSKYE